MRNVLLLSIGLLAGCGAQEGRAIRVLLGETNAAEQYISVDGAGNEIVARVGEQATLVVQNDGHEAHSLMSASAGIKAIYIAPQETVTQEWLAPSRPGRHELLCDVPGHKEKGMIGTVRIDAP